MKDHISHTQLTALVWAAALAPAAELLPAIALPTAGKGAWLAPLAAIPLVLLGGWLLARLSGGQGLAPSLHSGLGLLGVPVLLIYMVWGELLLALRLRLCAQRLVAAGYRDGTLWFFLLAVAGVTLWMGLGRVAPFARAGQVFLTLLLVTGGVVLLLSLSQVRPERTLPLWVEDVIPVLRSGPAAAGALGWSLYGVFLAGQVRPLRDKRGWHWLAWGAGGCLLLTLAQWIILGSLGADLAARLENPFFALAKSVGVEGAFQRVESVVSALWVLADLTLAGTLLLSLRTMAEELVPRREKWAAAGCVLLAVILAITLFAQGRGDLWNREIVPWGNLILGLFLPIGISCIYKGKGRGRYSGGKSCGKTDEKS